MGHLKTAVFLALSILLSSAAARAEANLLLTSHGRLLDQQDDPVNGTVEAKFGFYEGADTPAAVPPLWTATYQLALAGGAYGVTLGDQRDTAGKTLPASLFEHGELYLAVSIGNTELRPRLRVGTVPFSVHATTAAHADEATHAATATKADSATRADAADAADEATHAATADTADEATHAATATKADTATVAEKFGNRTPAELEAFNDARYARSTGSDFVALRTASGSTAQEGHLAITGTVAAGSFVGSGALLTGLNPLQLNGKPAADYLRFDDLSLTPFKNAVKTALPAGPGSGLDADTVDGLQGADLLAGKSYAKTGTLANGAALTITTPGDASNASVIVWEKRGPNWVSVEPGERGRLIDDPSLGAYYGFEETTGSTAADGSGRGKNLTLTDSFTVGQDGKTGKGLKFGGTGASGGGYGTNAALGLQMTTGLTMGLWMNPAEYNRDIHFFTLHRATGGTSHDVYFSFYPPNCAGTKLSLRGDITGGQCSLADIPLNTWTHVVATYDQTTGTVRIYVNGVLDNTIQGQTLSFAGLTMQFLRIGARFSGHGYDYIGRFDDALVMNRVLDADEIFSLYTNGPAGNGYKLEKGTDGTVKLTNQTGKARDVRVLVVK